MAHAESDATGAAGEQPVKEAEGIALAESAFERGDYAAVRRIAEPLARGTGPEAEAAADLLRRVQVDPAQIGVLLGCALFFLYVVWKYVL